jgi:hypothetical protein
MALEEWGEGARWEKAGWQLRARPNQGLELTASSVRSRFRQQVSASVDMIDIASGCAKRTYTSDFWRNCCVNHSYFLICTQGKSERLGFSGKKVGIRPT